VLGLFYLDGFVGQFCSLGFVFVFVFERIDCTMGFIHEATTIWEKIFGTFSKHRGLSQIHAGAWN